MTSLRILSAVYLCLLSSLCCAQDILAEIRKVTEAIKIQKTALLSNFEVMKTELKNEVHDMLEGAKTEWEALNTRTRNDLATLQTILDTDECLDLTHNCSSDALCTDTRTSFRCKCKPGFTGDGYTCEDIDECTDRYRCAVHATCKNTPGEYSCTCNPGFRGDGRDCQDIDECALDTHNCHKHAVCKNTVGSYTCHCTLYHEGDGIDCRPRDPICQFPSRRIKGLGCVTPVSDRMTWTEARDNCIRIGGRLLQGITSKQQLRELKANFEDVLGFETPYHDVWLGLYESKWLDQEGALLVPPSFWSGGRPLGGENRYGYVALQIKTPTLWDARSTEPTQDVRYRTMQSLCHSGYGSAIDVYSTVEVDKVNCQPPFKTVRGVGCIHISRRSQSWSESRDSCMDVGGDLFVANDPQHYFRLIQHFMDTDQKSWTRHMWLGVKEGVWLSGRKVTPEEEAPRNPSMLSGTCSYTDGDPGERFLLWTDPCDFSMWSVCEKKL